MAKEDWNLDKKEGRTYILKNKWDGGSAKEIAFDRFGNKETTYTRNGTVTKKYSSNGGWF